MITQIVNIPNNDGDSAFLSLIRKAEATRAPSQILRMRSNYK